MLTIDCSIRVYQFSIWVATYKTSIHHINRRNTIKCITTISPIQRITIVVHMQIITMRRWRLCTVHFSTYRRIMLALWLMLFSTYYAQNYAGIIAAGLTVGNEDIGQRCLATCHGRAKWSHVVECWSVKTVTEQVRSGSLARWMYIQWCKIDMWQSFRHVVINDIQHMIWHT